MHTTVCCFDWLAGSDVINIPPFVCIQTEFFAVLEKWLFCKPERKCLQYNTSSAHCNKICSSLRKGGLSFAQSSKEQWGSHGNRCYRHLHQEAEGIKCSCSDSFLLFLQPRAPDHGMVSLLLLPHSEWVFPPQLIHVIPHRLTQRFVA